MAESENARPASKPDGHAAAGALDLWIWRARAVLFWEAVWPRLAVVLLVVALFVSVSWFGTWDFVEPWARITGVGLFGLALLYALVRLLRVPLPDTGGAIRRIETVSGLSHRPIETLRDTIAAGREDEAAQTLWSVHRRRMVARLSAMRIGWPSPKLYRSDPYGLRAVVILLLVASLPAADGNYYDRVAAAFDWTRPSMRVPVRVDAWVSPPAYTRRAPIFLSSAGKETGGDGPVLVPEGSTLVVRLSDREGFDVKATTPAGLSPVAPVEEAEADGAQDADRSAEYRVALAADTTVHVDRRERTIESWTLSVIPDEDPRIRLTEEPKRNLTGSMTLTYELQDDYGIIKGEARFRRAGPEAAAPAEARPLYPAPGFELSLPRRTRGTTTGETLKDLTEHPWAGTMVGLTLAVEDEAAQTGVSEETVFKLPERVFTRPLAKALVEQRRILAMNADDAVRVIGAIDTLLLAPERFMPDKGTYLGLRFAYRELVAATSDDDLRDVVDLLWEIARDIEDGNLSEVERALKQAQEALREAIERGASDEEIRELTQNLREAMSRYLQSLARQAERFQNPAPIPPNANLQSLNQSDLDRLLQQIENLARSGNREQAQELLSQLQEMLNNLRMAQPGQGQPQQGGSAEMNRALEQLADIIRRQQELMDETFRLDRGGPQQGQPGQGQPQPGEQPGAGDPRRGGQGQSLAEMLRRLQPGQQGLQGSLESLQRALEGLGLGRNGQFGQAGRSMGEASKALGQGRGGEAVGRQGEALQALRQGARGLLEQLLGQTGQGDAQMGLNQPDRDPAGRPRRTEGPDLGLSVKIPDEIDVQRAREILEELRRRLSQPLRPRLELDYLERLLGRD